MHTLKDLITQLETMSFPKMTRGKLCPEMVYYVMELVHLKTEEETDSGVFLLQDKTVCPLQPWN